MPKLALVPIVVSAAVALAACSRPPEAPTELEELCAFLYEHLPDEDPEALSVAVDNLERWLDGELEGLVEGYTVATMSQAALDALEGDHERDATAMVGGAVGTVSDFGVGDIVATIMLEDPLEVYPEQYHQWDRTFRDDPACFVGRDCESILYDNATEAALPLNLRMASENTAQYRWVEASIGATVVSRSWIAAPARDNLGVLRVQDQHYLSVTMPHGGELVRVQAVWADAEIIGLEVPEATALNMLISSMISQDEAMYAWLAD